MYFSHLIYYQRKQKAEHWKVENAECNSAAQLLWLLLNVASDNLVFMSWDLMRKCCLQQALLLNNKLRWKSLELESFIVVNVLQETTLENETGTRITSYYGYLLFISYTQQSAKWIQSFWPTKGLLPATQHYLTKAMINK